MKALTNFEVTSVSGGISNELLGAFAFSLFAAPFAYSAGYVAMEYYTNGAETAIRNDITFLNKRAYALDNTLHTLAKNVQAVSPVAVTQIK